MHVWASRILSGKKFVYQCKKHGLIPGLGGAPGEENGKLPHYSCLGNPVGRGAWWATVCGVTKSQTQLSD